MGQLKLFAYAKITLSLDILRRLNDGYHELQSVMQQINLSDQIKIIEKKDNDIQIISNTVGVPSDKRNLTWMAIDLLRREFNIRQGVDVYLKKAIPIGGGLAGGSADAACILVGLNRFWKLGLSRDELVNLGSKIGYDVCFCIIGGTAFVTGKGETVMPLTTNWSIPILVANPGFGINTKLAYQTLDLKKIGLKVTSGEMAKSVISMNLDGLINNLHNDFETTILDKYCKINQLKTKIQSYGALGVLLSGSGSSVYGVMSSLKDANKVATLLRNDGLYAWSGLSNPGS